MKFVIISLLLVLAIASIEARSKSLSSMKSLNIDLSGTHCYLFMDGGSSGVKVGFMQSVDGKISVAGVKMIGTVVDGDKKPFPLQPILQGVAAFDNNDAATKYLKKESETLADGLVAMYKRLVKERQAFKDICFKDGTENLVNEEIILMATAGIRKELLAVYETGKANIDKAFENDQQKFRYAVESALAAAIELKFKDFAPVTSKKLQVKIDIISGTFEGFFGFISAVLSNGNAATDKDAPNVCAGATDLNACLLNVVYFENGGASVQFAFLNSVTRRFARKSRSKGIVTLTHGGKTYQFWSQSFLGIGAEELRKSIKEDPNFKHCQTCNTPPDNKNASPDPVKCRALIDSAITGTKTDKFGQQYGKQWDELRSHLKDKVQNAAAKQLKLLITSNPLSFNLHAPKETTPISFVDLEAKVSGVCSAKNDPCSVDQNTDANCLNAIPFFAFVDLALLSEKKSDGTTLLTPEERKTLVDPLRAKFDLYVKRDYQWVAGALWTLGSIAEDHNLFAKNGDGKKPKTEQNYEAERLGEWPFNKLPKNPIEQENFPVTLPKKTRRMSRKLRNRQY